VSAETPLEWSRRQLQEWRAQADLAEAQVRFWLSEINRIKREDYERAKGEEKQ
jgi:hypothetical protein